VIGRPGVTLDPAGAFGSLRQAWEQERSRDPGALFEAGYVLAGRPVRLRIVGHRLARQVARPFAHLRTSTPGSPELTVDLYGGWLGEPAFPAGPMLVPGSGVLASSVGGRMLAYERPDSLLVLDRWDGHLVGRIDPGGPRAGRERARPLSLPLAVWCGDREVQVVHAGLVAREGQGVLLGGASRAGKSTAALACAVAGFDFLGDDCVALGPGAAGTFEGHSLYSSAGLDPCQLAWFPALTGGAMDPAPGDDEKAIVFVSEVFPGAPRMAPIRLLVLPRIVMAGPLTVRAATKAEALLALAPSSLIKRAVPARPALRGLARLVERVPCYWLDVDTRLDGIPRRIEALLTEVLRG
jgi:hypothetical protein